MYATDFVQVGQNIQNAIKERGFTQQRLADELSVSKQVVNKIVKGQKAINVSELSRIATILGTTTDMLLSVETVIDVEPKDWLSFMGQINNEDVLDRVHLICSAIDEIHLLEELINE